MEPADNWEKLSDALLGPFEREIIDGLTGAYRALEPKIEQAFKRSLSGGSDMPLRQLLFLRQELEQELSAMRLPPNLAQVVNQSLLDGQKAADFWALAEMNKAKQVAKKLTPEQAAELFANATNDTELLLTPSMVRQNPSAMIAAAQRSNALSNYAAGARGTQAFATLNRLVDVDLRGRIIGAVEFHLASGDSWRQLRSTLQNSVELSKSRAQTVARTEMAAAMVEGTKLRYEAEGIQQVQWQAVGSSRTCGYCAPRHGKVYKLGEVVAPAHPNCRCTVTPWDPKWLELGIIDPQAEAKARADVLADLEAAGKQPISGPSPFEKALGREQAPEPLWTPPTGKTATKSSAKKTEKPALKPLDKMTNGELVKELEETFDIPVPSGLRDDRPTLLQELADRREITLEPETIAAQASDLVEEFADVVPERARKVEGAYSKLQKEFNAPTSEPLGKGNAAEVVITQKGDVIKWGQIGEFEADALRALDGTGVAPRLLDYEDLQLDFIPGAGSAADKSLAFVGRYDGLIKMSRVDGVPFEVWREGASAAQIEQAKEAFLDASKTMHLKGVAHNDRHDINFLVSEKKGAVDGLFVDFGAAQVNPKAALVEAMGNTNSRRDFQATYIGTQDGQAQGQKWTRFQRNLAVVEDILSQQPRGAEFLQKTVRTSSETLDKLITDEQALDLLRVLYEGV